MTISMKVLCKVNSGVVDSEDDGDGDWPFSLPTPLATLPPAVPFSFSGLSLVVSLTGGAVGRTVSGSTAKYRVCHLKVIFLSNKLGIK